MYVPNFKTSFPIFTIHFEAFPPPPSESSLFLVLVVQRTDFMDIDLLWDSGVYWFLIIDKCISIFFKTSIQENVYRITLFHSLSNFHSLRFPLRRSLFETMPQNSQTSLSTITECKAGGYEVSSEPNPQANQVAN